MTNISKRPLKTEVSKKINSQFSELVSSLKGERRTRLFLEEFFSDSEMIMFSKRLAIIFMLNNNISFSVIKKTLKVSAATISKIANVLDRNGYGTLLKEINKKKIKEDFQSQLEVILRVGMPPIAGRGRWKNFYKNIERRS